MKYIFIVWFCVFVSFALSGCGRIETPESSMTESTSKPARTKQVSIDNNYLISSAETVADRLEVYYFHSTARCKSCKTIGRYVKETIEQKYAVEVKSGQIDYREINVDLPENKEQAAKFQASGSSLFINRIKDGQDNIEPDVDVWRLLSDEAKFKDHLENKIDLYLGL